MREIKFRFYSKDAGQYVQVKSVDLGGDFFIVRYLEKNHHIDGMGQLEQFTGLHDKNGKEIYEGDIVKFEDVSGYKDGCASVIWHEDSCGYYLENDDDNIYDTLYDFTPSYQIEIIGNIHENPELLEASC